MTIEQIAQRLGDFWIIVRDGVLFLGDLIVAALGHITQDHLEGALVMTAVFLGPSLVLGLFRGFWEGLRIEWRHLRERPRAIDGDTIEIRGETIRLFALDAPELGQPWWLDDGDHHQDAGMLAKEALEKLVQGRRLSVQVLRDDQYRRAIAIVKVDGQDVGRALVSQGYAFASPGSKRYQRAENSAKRAKRGFWRGELQRPWDYRAAA